MHITVTGKQLDIGESLRGHVEALITATVGKYFGQALDAQVVVAREAHLFRADVSVHVGRGIMVQGHGSADEAYEATDAAIARVAKRLRRYKRRLRDHHKDDKIVVEQVPAYVLAPEPHEDEATEHEAPASDGRPVIIAETTTPVATLSVSDAVMRLNLTEQPVLVFRHAGNGRVNIVYRRVDGHIGWVDPPDGGDPASAGRA